MIKRMILFIGLVTAFALLAAVPAMATSVECDDCSMQVVVKNNSDEEYVAFLHDDKCMPVKSASEVVLPRGESFTGRMEYDKDAVHCQEIGLFAQNNGYFIIAVMSAAELEDTGSSKWEVHVGADGNGERIHFSGLIQKKSWGNLDCHIADGHTIECSIN